MKQGRKLKEQALLAWVHVTYALILVSLAGMVYSTPALAAEAISAPADDGASFSSSELHPDAADPCIIKVGETYYLFATTPNVGIPYYASSDLRNWTLVGNALSCSAFEGTGLPRGDVWAPEVRERTVGGRTTYVLTYTAADYWDGKYRICVAEASAITPGGFGRPRVLDTGGVANAIDSSLYFEGNDIWLYFKNEDEYHSLCVERLGSNWQRLSGPTTILRMDRPWETWTIEGPWVFKQGSKYYLMYSSGGYTTSNYCIGYATSSSPQGPFTKQTKAAPLVWSQLGVVGPGHNTTLMITEGEIYLVYHSLHKEGNAERRLMVDRMGIDDDGKLFVNFAGFGRQPLPSGTAGYYQVPSEHYQVSAHGVESLELTDVENGQSGVQAAKTVDTSSLVISIEDGYKLSDLWLFGGSSGLSGTAELLIDGEELVGGYKLSGKATKLTLPRAERYARAIEVRLSSTQRLSEVLLVSRGERWTPLVFDEAEPAAGTYYIQSVLDSRKVLDNAGDSKQAGNNVLLWEYNGRPNQRWELSYDDCGDATLINASSRMALDATGGSCGYGTNVEQWHPTGGLPQKWHVVKNNDGTFTLMAAVGNNMVVDIEGANPANGSNALLWANMGAANQKWRFIPADTQLPAEEQASIEDGYYVLHPKVNTRLCLDVANASMDNWGNLLVWTAKGSANQCFEICRLSDGYYRIANALSGKVLDVEGGSHLPGANVLQWEWTGADNQKWAIFEHGEGAYTLRNVGTGLALDVTGGSTAAGTNVEGWESIGSDAQVWSLEAVETPWQDAVELAARHVGAVTEGRYAVACKANARKVLDVSWASKDSGANVALWGNNGGANQQWDVTFDESGLATLVSVNSGMALTYVRLGNEGNVVQRPQDGSAWQKWAIAANNDGTVTLYAAMDLRYVLDAYGTSVADGTNIELYSRNGGANQRFLFKAVELVATEEAAAETQPADEVTSREAVEAQLPEGENEEIWSLESDLGDVVAVESGVAVDDGAIEADRGN